MECDRAREAISARIDGEDPGVPDPGVPDTVLEEHLAGCAACQAWQQRAHVLTRRTRLGGPFLDHDLTGRVLAAVPPASARRRLRPALRAALFAASLGQLAITVPLLILGHDHDAGPHAAHELGSFDLALAVAFAVGALRPVLSAGLAWTCGIAAAGLAGTAIADLIGGQTLGVDEAQHLIAVAGALLLLWQARIAGPATATAGAGTADATDWPQDALGSRAAGPGRVSQLDIPPLPPGDTAARVTGPDTVRVTPAAGPPGGGDQVEASQALGGPPLGRPGRGGDGKEAVA
jgi:predicted anti-sigma-YlaC factor YlaD